MSIVSAVRTFIATCPHLQTGAPLMVDHHGAGLSEYAIIPQPGARIVEHYLNDATLREFPFAFQSMKSTADDLERIENSGFFEDFSDWLDTQTEAGTLPVLGTKKTALEIEALGWDYLYEEGSSDTGIYQVQCRLTYKQAP